MPRKSTSTVAIRKRVPDLAADAPMAERIRRFNWAGTPLGPMKQWPANLRLAVEACLNSTTPALVWWGPNLINIYNDAHIPVARDRHPAGLGRPAPDVWADVWVGFAADVEAAIGRGVPVIRNRVRFDIQRGDQLEERWFTYSLSPVADGDGGIGGLILIGIEETHFVFAEREREKDRQRMETAARDARAAAEANLARWQSVIAGMADGVILSDAQGNLIDWNRSALDMHGFSDVVEGRRNLLDLATEFQLTTPTGRPVPFAEWPMSRVLRGEIVTDEVLRVRRSGPGRDLTIAYSGTQIRDRDGQVSLALLTTRKVTAARRGARTAASGGTGAALPVKHGETEESRIERFSVELAEDVDAMLHDMDLSLGERNFSTAVGQHLVEEAIAAYVEATRDQKGYDGSCIAAAVAVALMIVRDPA